MDAGIHFRTADGSMYFVRDELLEACKLEGEELEQAQRDLQSKKRPIITDSFHLQRDDMPPLEFRTIGSAKGEAAVAPTVMCCW